MSTYGTYAGYSHHTHYASPYGYGFQNTTPYATTGAGYYNGDGLKFGQVLKGGAKLLYGAARVGLGVANVALGSGGF